MNRIPPQPLKLEVTAIRIDLPPPAEILHNGVEAEEVVVASEYQAAFFRELSTRPDPLQAVKALKVRLAKAITGED